MFVYIMASKTRVIYVGVTNEVVRRVWEHRSGAIPGFTRRYGLDKLVYHEACAGPTGAIAREKQIKGWARVKKVAMIESMNPEWKNLAENWFGAVSSDDPSHSLGVTPLEARQLCPVPARMSALTGPRDCRSLHILSDA